MTRTLPAPDGRPAATVTVNVADGVRWATVTPVDDAAPDAVAAAVAGALPGHRVVLTDERVAAALVARGGRVQRHAHDFAWTAAGGVPAEWRTPRVAVEPVTERHVSALAPVFAGAYPPDHPDHDPSRLPERELRAILAGQVLGPLAPAASWVALDERAAPLGAVLVVDRPAFADQPAQLWIVQLFVDRAAQGKGVGVALVRRALAGAVDAGRQRVGLVVTDGNPARVLYERVGFELLASGVNVDLV